MNACKANAAQTNTGELAACDLAILLVQVHSLPCILQQRVFSHMPASCYFTMHHAAAMLPLNPWSSCSLQLSSHCFHLLVA